MKLSIEQGFTLIELMITLLLGLIISAAVMQVYLTVTKTRSMQLGGADILEASIFGIQHMENSIRLSNLGMSETDNPNVPLAGVVMTSEKSLVNNLKPDENNMNGIKMGGTKNNAGNIDITAGYLTRSGTQATTNEANAWKSSNSNIDDLKSSQLTIQYEAPQDMYDCEGNFVRGPMRITRNGSKDTIAGQIVIERYFLKAVASGDKASYESNIDSYELRCDAGRYVKEDFNAAELELQAVAGKDSTILKANRNIRDFGDAGEVVIPRVDYFGVLLGVEINQLTKATGAEVITLRYFTPESYITFLKETAMAEATATSATVTSTNILAIKTSILVRATKPLVGTAGSDSYEIFGTEQTLSSDTSNAFIRRVYESNVMLRNSRAVSVGGSSSIVGNL